MSFADDIRLFAQKTKLDIDTVHRKMLIDMAGAIINRSPVDFGTFKGNWVIGVGGINTATYPDIRDPGGNASLERIASALAEIHVGGVVYITNSLPYAIPLEYGHSGQAPNGMVRLTVREYKSYIENAVRGMK